jgi:hypothetical protein
MKPLKPLYASLTFVLVALLSILPLAFVTIPPMVDYPNHLARCAVLANLSQNPALQSMYEPRDALLPNMAMDAVVVPLAHFMSPVLAGKVFCALVLLLMLSGGFVLSLALEKKAVLWSFAPALFLFNHIFTFGFVNYLFGVGLLLWGLAAWVWMREKPIAARLGVGATFALVLFFSHLISMFLFGCAVAGFEVARWLDSRPRDPRALRVAAIPVASLFIVPALLLLRSPTHSEVSTFTPSSLGDKVDTVLSLLRTDSNRLDAFYSILVGGIVIALFATKTLRIEPRMRWAVGAVTAAFLLLPESFATCGCVDIRIPVVIAFLIASGSKIARPDSRMARFAVAALIAAFAFRTGQISRDWAQSQTTSQQVLADLKTLPEKSVVFCAADRGASLFNEHGWEPPLVHLPVAAMLTKPLFFPQLFALPTQHPLAIRPELRKLEAFQETDPFQFDDDMSLGDVVTMCHEEATDYDDIPPNLGRDPRFYLFVITMPGKPCIGTYPDAKLLVRRPRYAVFEITHTETAARRRWSNWLAEGLVKEPVHFTLRHVSSRFKAGLRL